mgnify:CR=1 FL=1
MATMRWNLFNSGADKAETEAAESRVRQARQTAYNFFDDLNLEIADTWTRYMAAIDQRKYYQEAVVYNTQTRDAYLAQFNLGQRSLLDVLDARTSSSIPPRRKPRHAGTRSSGPIGCTRWPGSSFRC